MPLLPWPDDEPDAMVPLLEPVLPLPDEPVLPLPDEPVLPLPDEPVLPLPLVDPPLVEPPIVDPPDALPIEPLPEPLPMLALMRMKLPPLVDPDADPDPVEPLVLVDPVVPDVPVVPLVPVAPDDPDCDPLIRHPVTTTVFA